MGGGGQKNKYFLGGGVDFVDIFGGSSQNWTFLCILRVFSEGQCTEWGIFLGVAKISNIFSGCLKFLIFFPGEG